MLQIHGRLLAVPVSLWLFFLVVHGSPNASTIILTAIGGHVRIVVVQPTERSRSVSPGEKAIHCRSFRHAALGDKSGQ